MGAAGMIYLKWNLQLTVCKNKNWLASLVQSLYKPGLALNPRL